MILNDIDLLLLAIDDVLNFVRVCTLAVYTFPMCTQIYTFVLKGNKNNTFLSYTQRNIFEILLKQPEIRLYLPFSD